MAKRMKVAEVTELEPGEGKAVEVEGVSLALFNVDGSYYAIASECTHVGGPLGEGALIGKEVTCPWHGTGLADSWDRLVGTAQHLAERTAAS